LEYLVAGGIGIAPLCFLARHLLQNGVENITVFFGGRSAPDVVLTADFKSLPVDLQVTTDDGSFGQKGFITEILQTHVVRKPPEMIYACGPTAMLQAVAKIAGQHKIACQVSLEATMACGMGACLGCAVKNSRVPDKYAHVCIDGPVFDLNTFGF
jgi:dihydroorotate dehydrogenase electron transfer subunit